MPEIATALIALALSWAPAPAAEAPAPACAAAAPREDASTWADHVRGRAAVEAPGPPEQSRVEVHVEARGPSGAAVRVEAGGRTALRLVLRDEDGVGPGEAEGQVVVAIGGEAGLRVSGEDADGRPLDVALDVGLRSCGEEP